VSRYSATTYKRTVPSQPAQCNSYRTPQCHDTQLQHTNVPYRHSLQNVTVTAPHSVISYDSISVISNNGKMVYTQIQFACLYQLLQHPATLECKMSIGNMSDRLSVHLSVCLSVHLSVTRWYCLKTYKLKITWFSPSCRPGTLVSSDQLS